MWAYLARMVTANDAKGFMLTPTLCALALVPATDFTYVTWFHGEGNGDSLQYSCLENPMDGGAWQAAVHGVAKSWTRLSNITFTFHFHALEKEMATHSSGFHGEGNGDSLQYSSLENPRDGGAWWAAIYGVTQSRTRLNRLSSSSRTWFQQPLITTLKPGNIT